MTAAARLAPLMSSDSPDWNTPREIIEPTRRLFDGSIDLDPCSNPGSIVDATVEWYGDTPSDDGLALSWDLGLKRETRVYVNPPYGRVIGAWTRKCAAEGFAGGAEIVALLPARVDTGWWFDDVLTADAVLLWRGRLKFLGAPSAAPFPSAVAYWGPAPDIFAREFGASGWLVRLR